MNHQEVRSSPFEHGYRIQHEVAGMRRNVVNSLWGDWGDQSALAHPAGVAAQPTPTLYFNPYCLDSGPLRRAESCEAAETSGGILNDASCSSIRQTSESERNGGKSSNRWTEEQTAVLVREWKENLHKIESSRNMEAWQDLTAQVNLAGPKTSPKQCKDKLKTLKQAYKDAKANNKESGRSPKWSPFFEEFDEVLGTRPVITTPGVIQTGQRKSSSSRSASASPTPCTPAQSPAAVDGSDSDNDDSTSNHAAAREPGTAQKRGVANKRPGAKKRRRTATNGPGETDGSDFNRIAERMLEVQANQLELLNDGQKRAEEM